MKRSFVVWSLALIGLVGCDAVVGETLTERRELEIEVNEALTVSHLKSVTGAELTFRSLVILDTDQDGRGEFGFLGELTGAAEPRGPGAGLKFPLLPEDFQELAPDGSVRLHGYLYRVYLPGPDGAPVREGGSAVDADRAEADWAVHAWPEEPGVTGRRSFFASATGDVWAAELSAAPEPPEIVAGLDPGPAWTRLD